MASLFQLHIDTKARGKSALEPDADAQADDLSEGAAGYGRGEEDGDGREGGVGYGWSERDVGKVDDGERAEGEWMLRVGHWGDEV